MANNSAEVIEIPNNPLPEPFGLYHLLKPEYVAVVRRVVAKAAPEIDDYIHNNAEEPLADFIPYDAFGATYLARHRVATAFRSGLTEDGFLYDQTTSQLQEYADSQDDELRVPISVIRWVGSHKRKLAIKINKEVAPATANKMSENASILQLIINRGGGQELIVMSPHHLSLGAYGALHHYRREGADLRPGVRKPTEKRMRKHFREEGVEELVFDRLMTGRNYRALNEQRLAEAA